MNICSEYASTNTILYNETKTKCVCFKPKSLKTLKVPTVYLNNTELKFVQSIKYLGVFLNDQSNDEDDLVHHRRYLYAKGNSIITKFKNCSDDVKHKLFKTFCNNAYGGHLWSKYKSDGMYKVKVAFNDIYRKLFDVKRGISMSEIYVRNSIDGLNVILRKACFRFRTRLFE